MPHYCVNQWGLTQMALPPNIPTGYCNPPTGLAVAPYMGSATLFSWLAPHDVEHFLLEYRKVGDASWIAVQVRGQAYVIELAGNSEYEWKVTSVCSVSNTSTAAVGPNFTTGDFDDVCIPPVIGNVTFVTTSAGVTISWTGITALRYDTELRVKGTTVVITKQVQTPEVTFGVLIPDTVYEIRIKSICSGKESEWSEWFEFNSGTQGACPQVKSLVTVIGISAVSLSWIKPSEVTSVNILLDGDIYASGITASTVSISGLSPDTEYDIAVVSVCGSGNSDPLLTTVKTKVTSCAMPTDLVLDIINGNQLRATWTPAPGIAGQEILLNNGSPQTLAGNVTTYTYTIANTGVIHTISVRSVCAASVSAYESKTLFMPFVCAKVVDAVVTVVNSLLVRIQWTAAANVVKYVVNIHRDVDDVIIRTAETTNGQIEFAGLIPNFSLYAIIVTHCTDNTTATSNEIPFVTIPLATCVTPDITGYTELTTTSVKISFVLTNGETFGNFRIEARNEANTLVHTADVTQVGTYLVPGLTIGDLHQIKVINLGNGSCTAFFDYIDLQVPSTCPVPTGVTAVFTTANNLQISFTPPGSPPTGYKVYVTTLDGTVLTFFGNSSPININITETFYPEVKLASLCSDTESNPVLATFTCPRPRNIAAQYYQGAILIGWNGQTGGRWRVKITSAITAQVFIITITDPFYRYNNPIPNSTYFIEVDTICAEDFSPPQASITINVGNGNRVIEDVDNPTTEEEPIIFQVTERDADPTHTVCIPIPNCPPGFQAPTVPCTGTNNCGCGCNTPGTNKPYLAGNNIYIEDKGTHFVIHSVAAEVGLLTYQHPNGAAEITEIDMPGLANKAVLAAFMYPNVLWHIIDSGTPTSTELLIDRVNEKVVFGTPMQANQKLGVMIRGILSGGETDAELPPGIAALFVFNEVPTGARNGSNVTYTTANSFVPGTEKVYLNGLEQTIITDYNTVGNNTILMVEPPLTGETLEVDYQKLV